MNHQRLLVSFILAVAASWLAADRRIVAAEFAVQQEPDRVIITDGGRPVATYVFRDDKILRPYFANVHAPGGIQVTRNHPPVPKVDATDHDTMHPGVWLALGDLSGHDFWRNKARIVHERFSEPPAVRDGQVTFTAENTFQAANGERGLQADVASDAGRASGRLSLDLGSDLPIGAGRNRVRRPGGDGVGRSRRHADRGQAGRYDPRRPGTPQRARGVGQRRRLVRLQRNDRRPARRHHDDVRSPELSAELASRPRLRCAGGQSVRAAGVSARARPAR